MKIRSLNLFNCYKLNLYQLQFDIPDKHPFNREDWYWQAYGEIILPIVQNNRLKRFWFTRYGALSPATTIIYPRIASFKKDTSLIVVKSKVPHSYITTFVT